MKWQGRTIYRGKVAGEALVSHMGISFFGGVDPDTGIVVERGHELEGQSVSGKVLVFPTGKGSTVGSYTLYRLKHAGKAPAAIVNLASPAADLGVANTSSYTAVKGAIVALTRQLAVELGPQGIRVNAVAPGAVPTPGARAIVDEAGYAKRRAQTPLGRLGEEDEIAAAIAFLLGRDASFITGEVLHADGGISVKSM